MALFSLMLVFANAQGYVLGLPMAAVVALATVTWLFTMEDGEEFRGHRGPRVLLPTSSTQ